MNSIYDWLSLAIFAGLIVLFLQRSTSERAENDVSLLYYLAAGVGCAKGKLTRRTSFDPDASAGMAPPVSAFAAAACSAGLAAGGV